MFCPVRQTAAPGATSAVFDNTLFELCRQAATYEEMIVIRPSKVSWKCGVVPLDYIMTHSGPLIGTGSWNLQLLKIHDGGRPPSWKIAISQPGFERFRQNLARRRSSTLLSVPTFKNLKFPKSKITAAAILKNRKSAISPERFDRSSRNLVRWRILGLRMGPEVKISNFWKSKMADGRHHEKSSYLSPDFSDFDKIWHADAVRPSWASQPLKIWNFQNPKWRLPPSWKIEKSPYLSRDLWTREKNTCCGFLGIPFF